MSSLRTGQNLSWILGLLSMATLGIVLLAMACTPAPPRDAPSPAPGSQLSGNILVDGSSTVYPITEAMAEEFGKVHRQVKMTIGISGTGGGFKKFCNNETDISDASRPIKPSEVEQCQKNGIEYIELPVAYDGLAVMVNPANTWASCMTVKELKLLWEPAAQGKITRWNQIRSSWPDRPINLYGPGTDSGTFDYFTEAIVGTSGSSRGDFQASEDDNVLVQGLTTDLNGLGYFGLAYYEENQAKLKLVAINDENPANGEGCILPNLDTVRQGTYQPLARPLFIYVKKGSADRPEVQEFVRFYLNIGNANALVREVGYIPLPEEAYRLVAQRHDKRVVGSLFGGQGAQTGVTVEELLRRSQ